jgi:hypothetical protein
MRKVALIILLVIPVFSYSQIDSSFYKDGKVTYWAVNQVDSSLKATDLMKNFNLWWADYCTKFNASVVNEQWKLRQTVPEKTETSIVVKGMFKVDQTFVSSMWSFDLTIECKNGRYRYTLTNIGNIAMYSGMLMKAPMVNDFIPIEELDKKGKGRAMIDKLQAKVTDIIFSLETSMSKKRPDDNF